MHLILRLYLVLEENIFTLSFFHSTSVNAPEMRFEIKDIFSGFGLDDKLKNLTSL